ncbi:right-handed parallel beta-helix repeat-containing protein [Halorubellus litoreus]|uniref:Right-handed parallel beta-helix repeat-containing protein n=1 Tax=Halorubellus litoreus TaxID=755308 RepID=A0ABD5VJX0_9EURY
MYDIVEEGADPTGEEPIDAVFAELEHDDAVIEFPSGTYKVQGLNLYSRENFTMRGIGDVTLVPSADHDENWIAGWSMRNFTFENFTLDHTATGVAPTLSFGCYDGLHIKDITKVGYHDTDHTAFGAWVLDSDGTGLVENLTMADGSKPVNPVGVYSGSKGTLTFRNCHIEGFGNNGLYASTGTGPIHVEGGLFKNNDRTQVRLGSPGSSVTGATIVVDDPEQEGQNQRGIRISDNPGPVTIDDCDITLRAGSGFGGIVGAFDGGSFTVTNTRIYVDEDYHSHWDDQTAPAIYVDEVGDVEQSGGGGERYFENVSITGGGHGEYPAVLVRRSDNTFENCCVQMAGSEKTGFGSFGGVSNNVVRNSNVNVPGAVSDDTFETENLTYGDSCPVPDGVNEIQTESPGSYEDVSIADAPVPGDASKLTYPVMGTDSENPTLRVYGNFVYGNTQDFALGNLKAIMQKYVLPGHVNVEFRSVAYPDDHYLNSVEGEERLAQLALGVWHKNNWDKYWGFFEYCFENQGDFEWRTYDEAADLLQRNDVSTYGWIPALAGDDEWVDEVVESRRQAAEDDLAYVPQIAFRGDLAGANWDTEKLLDWIGPRL